jgi:hypothetical protein
VAISEDKTGQWAMRVVGRRLAPARLLDLSRDTAAEAIAWRRAMPTPFVPRGVYRFGSHEEADAWLLRTLTRPARR